MNRDLRFCVVGAGAAGVLAAATLRRLGHEQVTLLEARDWIGGKCRTVQEEGLSLDVGAVFVLPNYPTVRRLTAQAGVRLRPAPRFLHLDPDRGTRRFGQPARPTPTGRKAAEYLRLAGQLMRYRQLFRRPLGELDDWVCQELALPFRRWVEERHLDYLHEVAYPLMRSFGFGYEEQEIPALYILKALLLLARNGNPLSLWDPSSIELWQIEEGYGELWRRIAAPLDVRLEVRIDRVERGETGGVAHTSEGTIDFDRLILACPLPSALGFLDASKEERELFRPIRSFDIWQLRARVDGLPAGLILDAAQAFSKIGRPMICFRYRDDANWYWFSGYADEAMDDGEIQTWAIEDIDALGGRIQGMPSFARWRGYFPHYGSREVAAGYHARLEALQGQRVTHYVGEILSPLGVEATARYAQRMIEKHFA